MKAIIQDLSISKKIDTLYLNEFINLKQGDTLILKNKYYKVDYCCLDLDNDEIIYYVEKDKDFRGNK